VSSGGAVLPGGSLRERPRRGADLARALVACAGAVVINALLFLMMGLLNHVGPIEPQEQRLAEVRIVRAPSARPPPSEALSAQSPSTAPPAPLLPPTELPELPSRPDRLPKVAEAAKPRSAPTLAPALAAVEQARRLDPSASEVDQPPAELYPVPPVYPSWARRRGIEGSVKVRLLIGEEGRVVDHEILEVEGHEDFREAVLDVLPRWRFQPATHEGRPVRVWGAKTVLFELQ